MSISVKQEQARKEFQSMIQDLVDQGWSPLRIAREISDGDEDFANSYRPAIAQKLLTGKSLPNWVVGEEIRRLHKKVIGKHA